MLCYLHFPGVLRQVWYFIVLSPDLCPPVYFTTDFSEQTIKQYVNLTITHSRVKCQVNETEVLLLLDTFLSLLFCICSCLCNAVVSLLVSLVTILSRKRGCKLIWFVAVWLTYCIFHVVQYVDPDL